MSGRRERAEHVAALVVEYRLGDADDLADELRRTVEVLRAHLETERVVNVTACIRETADAVLAALGDADTAQADVPLELAAQAAFLAFGHDVATPMRWDQAPEDFRVTFRMVADAVLTIAGYCAVVGDRAAAEGRDT